MARISEDDKEIVKGVAGCGLGCIGIVAFILLCALVLGLVFGVVAKGFNWMAG